jgi:transcriptional regulator with XRE-family HTH domain
LGPKCARCGSEAAWSLREVAALVGVHYTHVQKIEGGHKHPSSDLILKFALLFGVTADQLMRDDLEVAADSAPTDP